MSIQTAVAGDFLGLGTTALPGSSARTMACRFYKTGGGDNAFAELDFGPSWVTIFSTYSGSLYFVDSDGTSDDAYIVPYTAGTWYHVAITNDGTNSRMYLNGALVNTVAWNTASAPAGTQWMFGQADVCMQDIVLYNAKLSDAEVQQLAAYRKPKRSSNLLGWWPCFGNGAGGRGRDYSSNGRDLGENGTVTDGIYQAPAPWGTRLEVTPERVVGAAPPPPPPVGASGLIATLPRRSLYSGRRHLR